MDKDIGQSLKSEHLNLEELIYSQAKEIEELKINVLEIRALLKGKEEESGQQKVSKLDISSSTPTIDEKSQQFPDHKDMNASSKTLQNNNEVYAYTEENRSFIQSICKRKK